MTDDTDTALEPAPKGDGKFKSGADWTGNKNGRPKGIKNRITVQRLLVEEELREQLAVNAHQLLAKAILMAMDGNDRVMRALLDKLLATPKHSDDQDSQDRSVHVVIKNLTSPNTSAVTQPALSSGKVKVITTEAPAEGEIIDVNRRNA